MRLREDDVVQIAEAVWSMILGLALRRRAGPPPDGSHGRTITASVQISGAWEGVVSVQAAAALAARLTGIMFGSDPAKVTPEQVQDALGELTNMVGGNVKALLPEPCRLSLPTVVDGEGYVMRVSGQHRSVLQVSLDCDGDALVVSVLERLGGTS